MQTSSLPAKGIRARSECPPLSSASTSRAGMAWELCSGTTGSRLCWMPLPPSPGPHRTNCSVLSRQPCLPRTWMTAEPRKPTHRVSVGPMLAGACVCIGKPDPAHPSSSQKAKQRSGVAGAGGREGGRKLEGTRAWGRMEMPGDAVCRGPRGAGGSQKLPSLSPWPAKACGQRQETWVASWLCHLNSNGRVIPAVSHLGGWGAFLQHPKRSPAGPMHHKSSASFKSQCCAAPSHPQPQAQPHGPRPHPE